MAGRPTSERGKTAGYPEKTPDNKHEVQKPGPKRPVNPDEGGMERDPDEDAASD